MNWSDWQGRVELRAAGGHPDRRTGGLRELMNSFYSLVNQGALAGGCLLFGVLSHYTGVSRSILFAGLVAMSGLLLVRRYPLAT